MTDPVGRLAELAGIDLDTAEKELLARQLADLQKLIDALPDEGGEPGNPHAVELVLREDEPSRPLAPDAVAALMAHRMGAWLDLPPVREHES